MYKIMRYELEPRAKKPRPVPAKAPVQALRLPRPHDPVYQPKPDYAHSTYASTGYGHAQGQPKPSVGLRRSQHDDWDEEIDLIAKKLTCVPSLANKSSAKGIKSRPKTLILNPKTKTLDIGFAKREKSMAQLQAQLADRFGTTLNFDGTVAGQIARQLHELLVLVSATTPGHGQKASRRLKKGGRSVTTAEWLGSARVLCLARGGVCIRPDEFLFEDGSRLKLDEGGTRVL